MLYAATKETQKLQVKGEKTLTAFKFCMESIKVQKHDSYKTCTDKNPAFYKYLGHFSHDVGHL